MASYFCLYDLPSRRFLPIFTHFFYFFNVTFFLKTYIQDIIEFFMLFPKMVSFLLYDLTSRRYCHIYIFRAFFYFFNFTFFLKTYIQDIIEFFILFPKMVSFLLYDLTSRRYWPPKLKFSNFNRISLTSGTTSGFQTQWPELRFLQAF